MAHSFGSLGAFAVHLAARHIEIRRELERGLDHALERIEETARSEFGTYQPAAGEFAAWAPLADATQEQREALGYTPNDPLLRTGDLMNAVEREIDKAGLEGAVGVREGQLGTVMLAQEVGTSRIPPRPVLGPAAYRNVALVKRLAGAAVIAGIIGGDQIHAALGYDLSTRETGEDG